MNETGGKKMNQSTTISGIIAEAFRKYASRTALMPDDGFSRMTYGELHDMACRLATFLAENDVEPGNTIIQARSPC